MNEQPPRRKHLVLWLLFAVCLTAGWLFRDPLSRLFRMTHLEITEATFEQIQLGMSRAEVEQLLGGPPGDYAEWQCAYGITACTASTCLLFDDWRYGGKAKKPEEVTPVSPGGTMALWAGTYFAIGVEFDQDDRVVYKGLGTAYREPSILADLYDWLGW